jgi:hypothetical protein
MVDRRIGIPFRGPDGGVKADAMGAGSLIFIPLDDFLATFLAFF